uniref:5-methyltetrahydropteroyltriglutamate--homocysteine S-methyltransferase n=1 Tax=Oryza glumipatula TaxID=40148 RepID=A0A0E0BVF9_9ORYZ
MASHIVGYPRMGPKRELKFALESFWDGKSSAEDLEKVATDLRASIWKQMAGAGIKYIPSNTFSYYDQVLDTTAMLGAVPERYSWTGGEIGFSTYFSMARGNATVPAMEMTKWFDTNYHFIVPELGPNTKFSYSSHKAVNEYKEAKALGVDTVPVLVGPVSYLLLSKPAKGVEKSFALLSLLSSILPVYKRSSPRVTNEEVQKAAAALKGSDHRRATNVSARLDAQQKKLNLPVLPTTTIGSFPQTVELRRVRREYKAKKISEEEYISAIKEEISKVVKIQEELDIDVLVHGEPERNDMVEYFGEQLSGFAFTANGWVQSYGSRCVKPPIIYGDVSRPNPMTVFWSKLAQSMTSRPMKGMLTGPVTILNWSFVRNDQPRFETCYQIALAIKKEVEDLEAGGIQVIQIDEAALREGLPLRKAEHAFYLDWAVHSFRITNCGVQDTTQIHTHMCYSNFNDIIHSIINMDADVITIENSRSDEKLLSVFREGVKYGAGIGPGVYDIHSPRIPSTEEIADRVNKMLAVLDTNILWVNPDCGLKTRKYNEVKPALTNMVSAAKLIRTQLASAK